MSLIWPKNRKAKIHQPFNGMTTISADKDEQIDKQ
jgi:hypothetical protein